MRAKVFRQWAPYLVLTVFLFGIEVRAEGAAPEKPPLVLKAGVQATCTDATGNFVLPPGMLGTWKVNVTRKSNWASPLVQDDTSVRQMFNPNWGDDQVQELGGTPGHYWFKDSNNNPDHQQQRVHPLVLTTASLNTAEAAESNVLPYRLYLSDGSSLTVRLEQRMEFRYDASTDTWTAQYEMSMVNDTHGCVARTQDEVTANRIDNVDEEAIRP